MNKDERKEKWRMFFVEMYAAKDRLEVGKLILAYQAFMRAFEYAAELRKDEEKQS